MSPRALGHAVLALTALAACGNDLDLGSSTEAVVDPSQFVLPMLPLPQRAQIVHRYSSLDPKGVVPRAYLEDAIVYFDVNKALIPKQDYIIVVDFTPHSGMDRFWMVNLATGDVEPHKVAHGDGSDPDNDGYATLFGNVDGSHMSSLGFYLTGEIYDGTHPHSMRLDGLSADGSPNGMADTNVRERLIVVHEASYVSDSNTSQQGRSNGCLALDPAIELSVVNRTHEGTLIYAATSALNPVVGPDTCGDNVCDANEDMATCPSDCSPDGLPGDGDPGGGDPAPGHNGGCSTTGGAGLAFALALLGVRRRRR